MSFLTHLECSVCRAAHAPAQVQSFCRSCGKTLLARYDLEAARKAHPRGFPESGPPSLWKYAPLLPILQPENIVSLGELITPRIPCQRTGSRLGLPHLWVKDEGLLPTGSFKARGLAMAVSKAQELGIRTVCIPSAGNAAGALSAYAARAGMQAHIYLPEDTPPVNVKECLAYGAEVHLVQGNISDAARRMNQERKDHPEWFDVSTLKEPYRLEGKKTMGYELAEQFDFRLPDVILYPTGGGTGLIGMWKAFDEMEKLGWIGPRRPRMISVQAAGCAPIVRAFREARRDSLFWENAQTVASGLRVPKAFADHLILDALYDSRGTAVAVRDEEALAAVREIAAREGLFLCPEGGAAFAALPVLLDEKAISPEDSILVFNTAAGIKYPDLIS